jgi:hypothetical protein
MVRIASLACMAGAFAFLEGARADVGFPQVADLARATLPGRPLIDIRYRNRGGERFFTTASINLVNTLSYNLRVDAATGAINDEETEEIFPPEDLETAGVLARIGSLGIDFDDALAAANLVTGRSDSDVYRIGLSSDAFMILFDIKYIDDSRVLVDGVTGQVVSHGEGADAASAVPIADVANALARAATIAGPTWQLFDSEVLLTGAGPAWSTFFVNPANGRVKQVDFIGQTVVVNQYTPIGRLAERAAEVRAQLSTIVVTVEAFLADVEATYPGALVGFVSLDSRTRDGETRTRWNATVLTATGDAIEYSVDATVPIGVGLRLAHLVTPRVESDLTGDGRVLSDDLVLFFECMGTVYPPCDFDRDGEVTASDLALLLRNWG